MLLFFVAGQRRRSEISPQQLPADAESGLERPPNLYGDDSRHPDVHGSRLRPAERSGQRLQSWTYYFQRSGGVCLC